MASPTALIQISPPLINAKATFTTAALLSTQRRMYCSRSHRRQRDSPISHISSSSSFAQAYHRLKPDSKNINKLENVKELYRLRQEFITKWCSEDPYDALFGQSNRLRKVYKTFWRYLDAKGSPVPSDNSTSSLTSSSSSSSISVSNPDSDVIVPKNINTSDATSFTKPDNMEYDPITNRMIYKCDKGFSHYGQDLDVVTSPKTSIIETDKLVLRPTVAELIIEVRQNPEKLQEMGQTVQLHPKSSRPQFVFSDNITKSKTLERREMETSYDGLHPSSSQAIREQIHPTHGISPSQTEQLTTSVPNQSPPEQDKISRPEIEKLQTQIYDLNIALENLRAGSLKFDLTRQKKELERLVADIKVNSRPNSSPRKPVTNSPNTRPFDLVFGNKPEPKSQNISVVQDATAQRLESEIKSQKEAMMNAETVKSEHELPLNHQNLVKTIQQIYESKYGSIKIPDTMLNLNNNSAATLTQTPTIKVQNSHESQESKESNESSILVPTKSEITAKYTIFTYDPSTSEVSTTTISAPVSTNDTVIPLTVALTKLGEPGKFLSQLRLLNNNGTVVSVSENLLVLRSENSAVKLSSLDQEAPPSNRNNSTMEGNQSISHKNWNVSSPQRIEPVFSGRSRRERRRQEQHMNFERRKGRMVTLRKWIKILLVTSGIGTAILYVSGLAAGLKRIELPERSRRKD